MEDWVLDLVFRFLRPLDLLACSQVSKEFCVCARSDAVWKRHKKRIVKYNNDMDFDWRPTWEVFVQCLMPNILKLNNFYVLKLWMNILDCCSYSIISINNTYCDYSLRIKVNPRDLISIDVMFVHGQHDKFVFDEDKLVVCPSGTYEECMIPYYCVIFDYMEYFYPNLRKVDNLFKQLFGR